MKPKYSSLLTLFILCFFMKSYSQEKAHHFWQKNNAAKKSNIKKIFRKSTPHKYTIYQLDFQGLSSILTTASKRSSKKTVSNLIISIPNAEGEFEKFSIIEASILTPKLQKKYPDIRSFSGQGINDPSATIRFSISKIGLHAMVLKSSKSALFIDPYNKDGKDYIVYSKKDLPVIEGMKCLVEGTVNKTSSKNNISSKAENANDGKLRTFRLALAATGEYSQFHLTNQGVDAGETDAVKKAAVIAAMNNTMTRVNGIFERDLSITMTLIDNTNIIFLDGTTDPFTNDDGGTLIGESQTVIDAQIDPLNENLYDIGHTFSTGGGGLAQLNSPCTLFKASGITGSSNPIGDSYDIDYVAHEMGHQFGANHTFNGDAGSCGGGNRNNATAAEPGSGSTIMAYAGICAPQNVQQNGDFYFHIVSIQEMWANISAGNSTCATQTDTTNNNVPSANAGNDYTIPKSTPFVLTGAGSDLDGDAITYCWEQIDTEIAATPLVSTETGGPAFRSYSPTNSENRYFPKYETVLNGNLSNTWEVLPSVSRTLDFALTVRDNNIAGGQAATDEMTVTIDDTSNPFEVTSQNVSGISLQSGNLETITWEIGNTNNSPINCSSVNILLSTDGGLTFPTVLALNTPNDGIQEITVPNLPAPYCRIMIEPTNNIFYSINKEDFAINYVIDCTTYTDSPNTPILDGVWNVSQINVAEDVIIANVSISVDISHTYIGDLLIQVVKPNNTTELILFEAEQCAEQDNLNVVFDDKGETLFCASPTTGKVLPISLLSTFNGESSVGNWQLEILDGYGGDEGVLNSWSINICSETEIALSVNKFEFGQFTIYPNPSNGNINISLISNSSEDINIQLFDTTGRLISTKRFKSFETKFSKEINFGDLASGVYLLKVKRGKQISSKQLIIY